MRTPEGYEKDEIKKYLDSIGAWYFCPYMAGFGKSGVPDIVACIQGKFWAIEVKREGKEPAATRFFNSSSSGCKRTALSRRSCSSSRW